MIIITYRSRSSSLSLIIIIMSLEWQGGEGRMHGLLDARGLEQGCSQRRPSGEECGGDGDFGGGDDMGGSLLIILGGQVPGGGKGQQGTWRGEGRGAEGGEFGRHMLKQQAIRGRRSRAHAAPPPDPGERSGRDVGRDTGQGDERAEWGGRGWGGGGGDIKNNCARRRGWAGFLLLLLAVVATDAQNTTAPVPATTTLDPFIPKFFFRETNLYECEQYDSSRPSVCQKNKNADGPPRVMQPAYMSMGCTQGVQRPAA